MTPEQDAKLDVIARSVHGLLVATHFLVQRVAEMSTVHDQLKALVSEVKTDVAAVTANHTDNDTNLNDLLQDVSELRDQVKALLPVEPVAEPQPVAAQ